MMKKLDVYLAECYQQLTKHCYHNNGAPIFDQQKINKAVLACQFDLLVLLKNEFSSLEKISMLTAKEYWLHEALELTPVIQLLAQKLSDGLAFKAPAIRAKRKCLLALLSQDENDNLFTGLDDFFENFAVLDLPLVMVKPLLDNHFEGALKKVDYKAVESSNSSSFSFKIME